jgi:hypothetical protein
MVYLPWTKICICWIAGFQANAAVISLLIIFINSGVFLSFMCKLARATFTMLDVDGDGKVSWDDIRAFLARMDINIQFMESRSGRLSKRFSIALLKSKNRLEA